MNIYDFDKIVDRKGTGGIKFDALKERYGNADLIPMWVADMDFEAPSFITDALRKRLEHPIFGYTHEPEEYWPTVIDWIKTHHDWEVKREWITYIPGIVKGIGMVVNVFLKEDEKVIIQPPVYHPFRLTPQGNNREIVNNPLIRNEDGSYSMDFENLEKVADDKCRLLILSNPHNPAGLVWDKETLKRLAEICHRRNIIVISDEIHCDLVHEGHKHIPFATVSDEAKACSITFGAPTKTFNIPGIVSSYAIVPDENLRNKFYTWLSANELCDPNLFAPIATIAVFKEGETWRKELLKYIEKNIELVIDYCAENITCITPLRPQASYLIWLDCRELNLTQEQLNSLFVDKAGLTLNDGEMFGEEGIGFMRMNVATQHATVKKALDRLAKAVREL